MCLLVYCAALFTYCRVREGIITFFMILKEYYMTQTIAVHNKTSSC